MFFSAQLSKLFEGSVALRLCTAVFKASVRSSKFTIHRHLKAKRGWEQWETTPSHYGKLFPFVLGHAGELGHLVLQQLKHDVPPAAPGEAVADSERGGWGEAVGHGAEWWGVVRSSESGEVMGEGGLGW